MKTFFVLAQNHYSSVNLDSGYSYRIDYNIFQNFEGQTSNLSKLSLRKASVKLVMYDMLGREVATLVNKELKPGTYEADWDASSFSSGVYFSKIISNEYTETKKMVLMK